jgi:polysaccharide biosynthesis protein PslH
MRIAYIVPYVPNRIRTRPFNLIHQLSHLGHEVVVFTLGSGKQDLIDAQTLKDGCKDVHYYSHPAWHSLVNVALAVLSRKPLQSVYSWQTRIALEISKHLAQSEFDIVHVEHLRGAAYGVFLKSRFPTIPLVWDSVDCISHLFEQAASHSRSFFGRFVTRFELSRTRKAEADLARRFDHVIITSSMDKNAMLKLVPGSKCASKISVLTNGVDLDYFHPNPEIQREKETIVFSGKMSFHANVTMARYFAAEIMPRIWKIRPGARLYIVGKDPSGDIKRLAQDPLVTVTGTVADIRPFLWRATVAVVPLVYGAGIQNKILEAMATATPVVTTKKALGALQALSGEHLLASNDPDEFAQAVLELIGDQDLRQRIGNSGANYVRTYHHWASVASQLENIYCQISGQVT